MTSEIGHDGFELIEGHAGDDVCLFDDQHERSILGYGHVRGCLVRIGAEFAALTQHVRERFIGVRVTFDPFSEAFERVLADLEPSQVIKPVPALKRGLGVIVMPHGEIRSRILGVSSSSDGSVFWLARI